MPHPETDGPAAPRPVVAYLLLSHKEPEQVAALAGRILELSPAAQVVVHHDRRADAVPWAGRPPARVHLVDRTPVFWGGWSIVEATLRMLGAAVDRLDADWFVIVSGEHWPVADLATWESSLARSGADALVPSVRLPRRLRFGRGDPDGNRFLARCVHRWATVPRPRTGAAHKALSALAKLSAYTHPLVKLEFSLRSDAWFVGLPRRRGPVRRWTLHKGTEWIAFNRRSAAVLTGVDPAVTRWFQRSHIPDESYIHTVLLHAPGLVVEDSLVTWVPPEPETATPRWMLLTLDQLPVVEASGAAFARKIDFARNPEVAVAIDARVDRRRSPAGPVERPGTAVGDR